MQGIALAAAPPSSAPASQLSQTIEVRGLLKARKEDSQGSLYYALGMNSRLTNSAEWLSYLSDSRRTAVRETS